MLWKDGRIAIVSFVMLSPIDLSTFATKEEMLAGS
jgi:hypothetical protein